MLLIADTSPLISLIVIKKLDLLEKLFPEFYLPMAVWNELESHNYIKTFRKELLQLNRHAKTVDGSDLKIPGIDIGETEAILMYKELNADVLLIDDKKARNIAELMDIKCIGTIAFLTFAKKKKLITTLKPLFISLLSQNRYFSKKLLNQVLLLNNEELIK